MVHQLVPLGWGKSTHLLPFIFPLEWLLRLHCPVIFSLLAVCPYKDAVGWYWATLRSPILPLMEYYVAAILENPASFKIQLDSWQFILACCTINWYFLNPSAISFWNLFHLHSFIWQLILLVRSIKNDLCNFERPLGTSFAWAWSLIQ